MKRYGQKDGIILELHRNLNLCTARGARTIDQRQLFEKLSAIAAQLRDHGEHLDNYLTVHTFLQKFHARIQKAATKRCMKFETSLPHEEPRQAQTQGDSDWTLELWLNTIDNIIAEEERLQDMLAKDKERYISQLPSTKGLLTAACECCKLKGHKWSTCPKIPTPSARKAFLSESNRCLNCGSNTHRLASCTAGSCRKCQGKHHTAICAKNSEPPTNQNSSHGTLQSTQQHLSRPPSSHLQKGKPGKPAKQHSVITGADAPKQKEDNDTVVLQVHERPQKVCNKVILLVGSAKILDSSGIVREATVLLDTGSELSFIKEDFAKELGLPILKSTTLKISTFGSQAPSAKNCDLSKLQIRDIEGRQHEIRLFRSEHI
ncbi:hypothetical protein V3C99_013699, partial [Haemonchus contortus]